MAPVPVPKKVWVFDGGVEQYPSVLGSVHFQSRDCVDCHGGDDAANTRMGAHTGDFQAIPGGPNCADGCHDGAVDTAQDGLHTTLNGYLSILGDRGFPAGASDQTAAMERYEEQCTKCHTANEFDQTACGFCHVSVPTQAGGGFLNGHAFQGVPSMDNNCTACHGSRVKDEYYGLNNALLDRNAAAYPAGHPYGDTTFNLKPDVHKTAGLTCMDCHGMAEMHGEGHPAEGDRYDVTTAPACVDCHPIDTAFEAVTPLHQGGHQSEIDCYVCHAQPYKNCYGCHTDVTEAGVPFFKNNESDPTLADRKAAASDPATVAPDSLITFRAGINPKFGDPGQKQYSVLRHVPIDEDAFTYTGANAIDGLITSAMVRALPTWKYATPHTIQRNTAITTACANCHGANYAKFWLTNPVANSLGWVAADDEANEAAANAGVTLDAPISFIP